MVIDSLDLLLLLTYVTGNHLAISGTCHNDEIMSCYLILERLFRLQPGSIKSDFDVSTRFNSASGS